MFWKPRRKYSDSIQKICAKYFISTTIKKSNLTSFNLEFLNFIDTISKDEVSKDELYELKQSDNRDNQQYLIDILKLNNPLTEIHLNFISQADEIFLSKNNKEIKPLNYIYHLFFRVIIRFIFLFINQIEEKNSPFNNIDNMPKYLSTVDVALHIYYQQQNDIFVLFKPFLNCVIKNFDFILTNEILRKFSCFLLDRLLQYIQQNPFSYDLHVFIFSVQVNYFTILVQKMDKTDLLDGEINNLTNFVNFVSNNLKIISSKYSAGFNSFMDSLFKSFSIIPLKNCDLYYNYGFSSLSFFRNIISLNFNSIFMRNSNYFDFIIWTIDNFPIQNYPKPLFQFTDNFVSSLEMPSSYLACKFIDSPPLFSQILEENENGNFQSIVPEKILTVLEEFTSLILSINNSAFNSKIFEFFFKKLSIILENGALPSRFNHDHDTFVFYLSFLFSFLALKLPIKSNDQSYFVVLFSKMFFSDKKENYFLHSFYRKFIYQVFDKIFNSDPIFVVNSFQQIMDVQQLHIIDEIFLFFSSLLEKNSAVFISNVKVDFFPKYFYVLQKFNENRSSIFSLIQKIMDFDEGRNLLLNNKNFVDSIFNFLFSEQTRNDVSQFILSVYEKEKDTNCFNLVFQCFKEIFNNSKLPEEKRILFFIHLKVVLIPILQKSRALKIDSTQHFELFESIFSIFSSLKHKEERSLISPILDILTIFTSNSNIYRQKCIDAYLNTPSIFECITIENIDDEIILSMLSHIYEYRVDSFKNYDFSLLHFKNPNGLIMLHNSTKSYEIHKEIFEKVNEFINLDLANNIVLSKSNFANIIIDFLKDNMNHPSFNTLVQFLDNFLLNNIDIHYFRRLCSIPKSNDIEVQNNWKRHVFQIIEALSATNEQNLFPKYLFFNGEKTGIFYSDRCFVLPFELKLNFIIQSYPKNNCDLISFHSVESSDLFSINLNHEGKLVIISNMNYKIETNIIIPLKKNTKLTILFSNILVNFKLKIKENNEKNTSSYEIKCKIPDFISKTAFLVNLFNSAKKQKKHSICAILFYYYCSFLSNEKKIVHCNINFYNKYISSNHINQFSDFTINGIVKYHLTNIFTFMRKEGGIFLLLKMIDNSILLLHFIHIINNLIRNGEKKFEIYFFQFIFEDAFAGFQNIDLNCWNSNTVNSFYKFTSSLNIKENSEFIIQNIWMSFNKIWLKLNDLNLIHFILSDIFPKFCSKFPEFFIEKTNAFIYITALEESLNLNNLTIMTDLLNLLFFYMLNAFNETNDLKQIKSFIFNSENLKLRIQFNLRLFGILNFDSSKTIPMLNKLNLDDIYQFFILFLKDLSKIDRIYIKEFITEDSFNILASEFLSNSEMQNIFFDLLIVCSEFIKSGALLDFISKFTDDLYTKILSSTNNQMRMTFLIFIMFHSSSDEFYDINKNSILTNFYSSLLAKDSSYFKNFIIITYFLTSFYNFDCNPFFHSIFHTILTNKLKEPSESIDTILLYAFIYIFYIPKNDSYYNNLALNNLFEKKFQSKSENISELKQISLFEFIEIYKFVKPESLFPLRFYLRINEEGNWIDQDLAVLLISFYESKERRDFEFIFTKNQKIYGIQIVTQLFIALIKSNHPNCWNSISFFIKIFINSKVLSSIEQASIQSFCYSLVSHMDSFNNFEKSFRLFCNRFYFIFENAAESLFIDNFLLHSLTPEEMEVILNSFSDVYHYQNLLFQNFGIYLSSSFSDFLKDYCDFLSAFTNLNDVEKLSLFNYNEFISSIVSQFRYRNYLFYTKIFEDQDDSKKPYLFFNDSFHPIMFTSFSVNFIEYGEPIDFAMKNKEQYILIEHCFVITTTNKISTYFIQKNQSIIIGGYSSLIESIKWVFQRSPQHLEFFFKNDGLMLLVEFDRVLDDEFINQFNFLDESEVIENWVQNKISNYDLILQLNFVNGRSFNDYGRYVTFPRMLVKMDLELTEELSINSFRNFKDKFKELPSDKIKELHSKGKDIFYEVNEILYDLTPEFFSMSEIFSHEFIRRHKHYFESPYIASLIGFWIQNKFNIKLPEKQIEDFKHLNEKKMDFECVPIYKIDFRPFDSSGGFFYSLSNDGKFILSMLKKDVLVHLRIPLDKTLENGKSFKFFGFVKDKTIIIYRRNYTGFYFASYDSQTIKPHENVIMSTLIENVGRLNENSFYIISSSKRLIICRNYKRISCFLEGFEVSLAFSNLFLNLFMVLTNNNQVILASINSLEYQRHFSINMNSVKWCFLDNNGIATFASDNQINSYDLDGKILASKTFKLDKKVKTISHVLIQNRDYLVVATNPHDLFILNPLTLNCEGQIATDFPIKDFVFDYHTGIGIAYDKRNTFFIRFNNI